MCLCCSSSIVGPLSPCCLGARPPVPIWCDLCPLSLCWSYLLFLLYHLFSLCPILHHSFITSSRPSASFIPVKHQVLMRCLLHAPPLIIAVPHSSWNCCLGCPPGIIVRPFSPVIRRLAIASLCFISSVSSVQSKPSHALALLIVLSYPFCFDWGLVSPLGWHSCI